MMGFALRWESGSWNESSWKREAEATEEQRDLCKRGRGGGPQAPEKAPPNVTARERLDMWAREFIYSKLRGSWLMTSVLSKKLS